jgi:hypothetical protein
LGRGTKEKLVLDDLKLFNRLAKIAKRPELSTGDEGKRAAVLRNLKAEKHVRDEAIAESSYAYSLGEVVGVFTQWSRSRTGLRSLDPQCEWAEHRFDIATMADVSEDVFSDLAIGNLRKAAFDFKKTDGRRA